MNGVGLIAMQMKKIHEQQYPNVLPGSRSIMIRPSISRGRGYAVVIMKDENEDVIIQPAPRTAKLARIGRFDSYPQPANFNDLPDTIVQKIFSHISDPKVIIRCKRVSKQWRRVIDSTYVKKPMPPERPFRRIPTPTMNALDTTKLKIFGKSKSNGGGIETASQAKENGSFREVTIRIDIDGTNENGNGNQGLMNYITRLAVFLTPTQACLLVDIVLTDTLISFLFTEWQPKLLELRLLRCSLDKLSPASLEILAKAKKLRHLYLDDCPIVRNSPIANVPALTQLCQGMTRLELCFCGDELVASMIDDNFLELLGERWKEKSDIRWLKLRSKAITTDGIENLIGRYFKLRYGSKFRDQDDKHGFTKVPKLCLWLCGTSIDVDDLLSRRTGKRWFREERLQTASRRKIQDSYSRGEDITMWVETPIG